MKILITCLNLNARSGAIISTRDLAIGLQERGHSVTAFSPVLGRVSAEMEAVGVAVTDDLQVLGPAPDLIHGHHHLQTVQALMRFPGVPALFVCRDPASWHDEPPLHPAVRRFVGIDWVCEERLRAFPGVPGERVRMVRHGFDFRRLPRRDPLPERPRRALIYSNQAWGSGWAQEVCRACEDAGIEADVVGQANGNMVQDPAELLGKYDVVFGKSRAAMEAAITGAAVVACDEAGLGPLLTSANIAECWQYNAAHRAILSEPVTRAGVAKRLAEYDAEDAGRVCDWLRANGTLERALDEWEALYAEMLAEPAPPRDEAAALRAALHAFDLVQQAAGQFEWELLVARRRIADARARETALVEADRHMVAVQAAALAAAQAAREEAEGRAAAAEAELAALRRSRFHTLGKKLGLLPGDDALR